jgi:hypothetical protein
MHAWVVVGWLLLPVVVLVVTEHLLQHLVVQVFELDHLGTPAGLLLLLPRRGRRAALAGVNVRVLGEVEDGVGAAHGVRGAVVCPGGLLGGVEGAEPHADAVPARVADLGGELAPGPAPHAAVLGVRVAFPSTVHGLVCLVMEWNDRGASRSYTRVAGAGR